MDGAIRESTEMELHPSNMNRENGFCLGKSWKSHICSLKNHRKSPEHYDELRSPWGYVGPHKLNSLSPRPFRPGLPPHLSTTDYTCLLKPAILHSFRLPHTPVFPNRHLHTLPSAYLPLVRPGSHARMSSEPVRTRHHPLPPLLHILYIN
jgi:hypothetical protein